ncbi:MAG TPA: HAMP domain-containing sensor histidine kinase [Candidatus Saccharimonadales bacterium]|nr:HAMP domain-containing sensor histidine kinase [Candidatus Saccharimonadales bacterium]
MDTSVSSPSNDSLPADVDAIAYISHELSTPLTAIKWNAELLRMGKMAKSLDEEQTKLLDEILLGVRRMSALVDDIHESSWLERNKFADESQPTSLADIVASVNDQQQAIATAKQVQCTIQVDPSVPRLLARPSTLTLIATNLLSNAVKYTLTGSVSAEVRLATADEVARAELTNAMSSVLLRVTDTGMGIPVAEQAQVFKKFFRGSNARSADIEGTGLGLYIVALAVQKLKGAIWFDSVERQGSIFSVVLPLQSEANSVN